MATGDVPAAVKNPEPEGQTGGRSTVISNLFRTLRFDRIVERLEKQSQELKSKVELFQNNVGARSNKSLRDWLREAEKVLVDMVILDIDISRSEGCIGCLPDWRQRYRLSERLAKMTLAIHIKLRESDRFEEHSVARTADQADGSEAFVHPKFFLPSKSSKLALEEIFAALKDDDVDKIGLVGIPGVGKTALAIEVKRKAKESFLFDEVVLVRASDDQHPGMIRSRIEKWLANMKEADKILIILDDVGEKLGLEDAGILSCEKNCKILITARHPSVCSRIKCQRKIALDSLSRDEARELLKQCAGSDLRESDLELADVWNGLPLAIVTAGEKLKGRSQSGWGRVQKCREHVFRALKLKYYDTLNDEQTKTCLLLCSLFREDEQISVEELTRRAIGQGRWGDFGSIEDVRRKIRGIISSLSTSWLLITVEDNKKSIKMREWLRGLAHWIARQNGNKYMVRSCYDLDWETYRSFKQFKAVSLVHKVATPAPSGQYHSDRWEYGELEILILKGNSNIFAEQHLYRMSKLTVLLLRYSTSSDQALSTVEVRVLELLSCLRTLHMESYEMHELPSLEKLKHLEILCFRYCRFYAKLDSFGELSSLKLLELSHTEVAQLCPNWLQKLSKLQELHMVEVKEIYNLYGRWTEEQIHSSLKGLNSSDNLTALSLRADSTLCPDEFVLPKLETYRITINLEKQQEEDQEVQFEDEYPTSRVLNITGFPLAPFKELFQNVESLILNRIEDCKYLVPTLDQGGLTSVKFVELTDCYDLESLVDTTAQAVSVAFSNLTILKLVRLNSLECLWQVAPKTLKVLSVARCSGLKRYLFTPSMAQGLEQLDTLEIQECNSLNSIFTTETQESSNSMLPNLTTLRISLCRKLQYVLPISVVEGHPQLQVLEITECKKLKHVFKVPDDAGNCELHKQIEIPHLRRLVLSGLKELKSICPGEKFIMAPMEQLDLRDCCKLEPFALVLQKDMPARIKEISLSGVGSENEGPDNQAAVAGRRWQPSLQHFVVGNPGAIFQFQGQHFFSSLKKLLVENAPVLRAIWEDRCQITSLQNLTCLELSSCKKLRFVFTHMVARNLPMLKHLEISECEELEQLIADEDHSSDPKNIAPSHHRSLYFPSLIRIRITNCHKLRSVFPLRIVQFPQLQELLVKSAWELKLIFSAAKNMESETMAVIKLAGLRELHLSDVPQLVALSPGGYRFEFPNLSDLTIEGRCCSDIKTGFFVHESTHSLYAETEKLESEEENGVRSRCGKPQITWQHQVLRWHAQ